MERGLAIIASVRNPPAHLLETLPTWCAREGVSQVVICGFGSEPVSARAGSRSASIYNSASGQIAGIAQIIAGHALPGFRASTLKAPGSGESVLDALEFSDSETPSGPFRESF